jgi:hypothetical protein
VSFDEDIKIVGEKPSRDVKRNLELLNQSDKKESGMSAGSVLTIIFVIVMLLIGHGCD